jgi:PTS system nitrogen regulatory IIA component
MDLGDILTAECVMPTLAAADKRALLASMCDVAARQIGLKPRDVLAAVWDREQLSSTGLGRGIAVPHGRLPGLTAPLCVFARAQPAVAYGSIDDEPVDLVFLLVGPETAGAEFLKALARIARLMREPDTARRLRAAGDRRTIHALLTEPTPPMSRAG